ncbi:uncharacterized protein [Blastocystis hominis]|uniref:Uncharacterized protein n=1 Tax=Blastocystis hominis TaxID=12968 RepID=D8M0J8_BLAHO|nr:uncharacterized protein [Blastocystis hominis]CBK21587.2 unnamed protein product [Blastocystis hominis]|eukprot:XP_012895635.1 uncharacterized protein [Blastocystis hominis]
MDNLDEQIRESQLERKKENGELASFGEKYSGQYDQDIYGKDDRDNYNDVIEDDDEVEDVNRNEYAGMHPATVNRRRMEEAMAQQNEVEKMRQEGGSLKGVYKLSERENDAQRQLRKYKMSPERSDPFRGDGTGRGYKEIMKEKELDDEEAKVYQQILEKQRAYDEARAVRALHPHHI